jgi:Hint domain
MGSTYTHTVILSNPTAQNPFTVASDGAIFSSLGDGLLGTAGFAWTLFNYGTISTTDTTQSGVDLTAGGVVVNGQSGAPGGLIVGSVRIDGAPGTVVNYGSLIGGKFGVDTRGGLVINGQSGSTTGVISGDYAVVVALADGTVVNYGTIVGAKTGIILANCGGTIINDGTVNGNYGGVALDGGASRNATLINSGLINGYFWGVRIQGLATIINFGVIDSPRVGIYNPGGGAALALVNYGRIAAAVGVASDSNRLTLTNDGTIIGTAGAGVQLGSTFDTVTNFGTITGETGTAVAFGSGSGLLVVEPGAVFNGVLAGFQAIDTIDLADTPATGATFSDGTLTVLNNGVTITSFGLPGQFSTGDFRVYSDGSGGSNIVLGQPTGRIIGGAYYGIVDLGNPAYDGSATVTSTGRVVGYNNAVVANIGVAGSLVNYGAVTAPGSYGSGVYLASGGFITNAASGGVGGYIGGGAVGVTIGGGIGTLTNSGTIQGGSGLVIASGSTATVTNSGTIAGTGGTAVLLGGGSNRLVLTPGAAFTGAVDGGGGASVLEIAAAGGTATGFSAASVGLGSVAYVSLGSVTNFSALQIDASATFNGLGALGFDTLVNEGQVNIGAGNALALGVAGAVGIGVIDLQQGGTIDFQGAVANQVLKFQPPGGTAVIEQAGSFAGTLSGFISPLDIVDLTGLAFSGNTSVGFDPATDVLTVIEGGGSATLQLDIGGMYAGVTWQASADGSGGTDVVPVVCFCRGTRILTDAGEVPVEALAVGNRVMTLSGALKPIRWIGFGRDLVTGKKSLARPIIVRAGALADDVPRRDLYLTHGHALYVDGVLIPVENLVNHRSILWDESARVVEYYHVELEDHDVVFAEGAPAETYYDADNRAFFQNTREGSEAGAARPIFAPVLKDGEAVEKIWVELFERTGGRTDGDTSDDPDLHLVVDGERLDPISVADGLYIFTLARAPAGALMLRSRSAVPSLVGISRHDHRRLGVAIRQIVLHQPGVMTGLDHDASVFAEGGCYFPEAGHSWTDGEFVPPAALFAHLKGAFTLFVHTRKQAMRYPVRALLNAGRLTARSGAASRYCNLR